MAIKNYLRERFFPHMWCPGCGLGTATRCFADAIEKNGIDPDKVAVVSGIGCTGRVAGYMQLDSFHTTHGRPIAFATGLRLARPDMKVVVVSGDGKVRSAKVLNKPFSDSQTGTCVARILETQTFPAFAAPLKSAISHFMFSCRYGADEPTMSFETRIWS